MLLFPTLAEGVACAPSRQRLGVRAAESPDSSGSSAALTSVRWQPPFASRMHWHHEPALRRTAAVSETSRSNVRTPTVHGKLPFASRMHCNHEPALRRTAAVSETSRSNVRTPRFMESFNVRGTRTATMNHRGLLPLRYLSRLARGWRRGPGRGGHLEFGYWSFLGICPESFRGWDLELPRLVHGKADFLENSQLSALLPRLLRILNPALVRHSTSRR
jgi:hypothetical protein